MEDEKPIRRFWTDGSAKPNPGEGGFAVLEKIGRNIVPVVMGRSECTTNTRMEGRAILECLKYANGDPCKIFTDSKFWVKVLKVWAPQWARCGWRKFSVGPIKNLDIVKELYLLYCKGNAKIYWVKGHSGSYYNRCADITAKRARLGEIANDLK